MAFHANPVASILSFRNISQRPGPGPGPGPTIPPFTPITSLSQPNHSDDWTVYQGRSNNGAHVSIQVKQQNSLSWDSVVCCVWYSRDEKYLATYPSRAARIFNSETGRFVPAFEKGDGGAPIEVDARPNSYFCAVCLSSNGNWPVTGARDHILKIWDVRLRNAEPVFAVHGTDVYSVDVSAIRRFIISRSGDRMAILWSPEKGE